MLSSAAFLSASSAENSFDIFLFLRFSFRFSAEAHHAAVSYAASTDASAAFAAAVPSFSSRFLFTLLKIFSADFHQIASLLISSELGKYFSSLRFSSLGFQLQLS